MNQHLHVSPDGQAVMHHFEKCVLHAYPDPASPLAKALQAAGRWQAVLAGEAIPANLRGLSGAPWTIGWGDTGPDVVPGLTITQLEADQRFARRLRDEFEPGVRRALRVPINQGQFDGLVAWAYNVGVSAAAGSTLIRLLNAGDVEGAAREFARWDKSRGVSMRGLRRRRAAEQALFRGATAAQAIAIAETVP